MPHPVPWPALAAPLFALLAISLFTPPACSPASPAPSRRTLLVYAAASLNDAFRAVAHRFEAAHPGVSVALNTAGSNQLRLQLEHRAPADVFASADFIQMDAAITSGLCAAADAHLFAHNQLVIITPRDNPAHLESLADLARPGVRLLIAEPAVPVGRYTATMLDLAAADPALGPAFKVNIIANIVSREQNVAAIVTKVRLGSVDAGFAYATDAAGPSAPHLHLIPLPLSLAQRADYFIAPLSHAPSPDLAKQFVAFLQNDARDELERRGFSLPAPAAAPPHGTPGT